MSKYTKQDIIRLVEEEDVEFIRLQFVDIYGNLKNTAVTTSQLNKVLDNKCKFDGVAIEGFGDILKSDLLLYPDLDTFVIFPWRPQQGKVARLICDVYNMDGSPFEGDSRYILKKVVERADKMGYTFDVGTECEFFLFNTNEQGDPTTETMEKGKYFDIGPIDSGENARREMVMTLEDMGFEVESSFHSHAPAQHEIDFKFDNALATADNIVTFKLVVRTIAKRHGLHATFMPKPKFGVSGSGMHVNMSLSKDGKNIFANPKDSLGLSEEGYQFMAGIMEHIKGMTLINNPIVNSYKRLVPGFGAPVYIGWSATNRTPLISLHSPGEEGTRIELRSPDAASNPYLVLAVCLAAGLDGIEKKLTPKASIDKSIFNMSEIERKEAGIEILPTSLATAIDAYEEDEYIKSIIGEHINKRMLTAKKKEWQGYMEQVTSWEVEQYLNRI